MDKVVTVINEDNENKNKCKQVRNKADTVVHIEKDVENESTSEGELLLDKITGNQIETRKMQVHI